MNAAARSTCSESAETDSVCGDVPCAAPALPASGGSTVHSKPSGAESAICCARYEPPMYMP